MLAEPVALEQIIHTLLMNALQALEQVPTRERQLSVTVGASLQKAFTSASAKNSTLAMMEGAQKNPAAANLTDIAGFLLLGGGVPGGHLDEQCALVALDQVKDQLK